MANISAIKLPDGVTYDLVDRVSTIDVATTSANGLMSSSDKTKLDGIASGAEVNYVSNITNNYETLRDDPPSLYVKSSTITYNGSYQTILLTVAAIGKKNGVCGLDASSKVPASMIPSGYANVQSDWNEADSTDDAYIKNKPTIPPKNVWYGTCSTSASIQQKAVTTLSGDFTLDEGNILLVEFASSNSYDGTATLSVDELTAEAIYVNGSPTNDHRWRAGEAVIFVYDGYHFNLIEQGMATTSYYGITKLSSSTSSTSELIAATPKAVKVAYDLADGKQDELVSGTNIKTINGNSILGSGDLTITGGTQVKIVRW